jgi:hypothetical protein
MRVVSSLCLLLLTIAPTVGQTPGGGRPVEPTLFLLYGLEDLYRAPLPDDAELFEAFVARQQLQYDQLSLYLSKQKKRDPELVAKFDEYQKVLDEVRGLLKDVAACQKKHLAPIVEANLKVRYEEMRQANAVLMTGLAHAFGTMSRGGSDDDAIKMGLSGAIVRAINGRSQVEAARAEAREKIKKALGDYRAELDSFYPGRKVKLQRRLQAGPPIDKELIARLGAKLSWPKDVDLAAGGDLKEWGDGDRPANPLWIERIVLRRKAPDGIRAIEFHHQNAKDLLAAAKMVPASPAFNPYRSRLYTLAGLSANQSSAAQIGTAGLKSAPTDAAKAGVAAWLAYSRLEPIALNDSEVGHQFVLAQAYAGQKAQAYKLVRTVMNKMKVQPPRGIFTPGFVTRQVKANNAAFWYDAARICSLAGDVPSAISCFYVAVGAGYRDFETARVDPDLATLRAGDPEHFEEIITPAKKGPRR